MFVTFQVFFDFPLYLRSQFSKIFSFIEKNQHSQNERDLLSLLKNMLSRRFRVFQKKTYLQIKMWIHKMRGCTKRCQKAKLVKKIWQNNSFILDLWYYHCNIIFETRDLKHALLSKRNNMAVEIKLRVRINSFKR